MVTVTHGEVKGSTQSLMSRACRPRRERLAGLVARRRPRPLPTSGGSEGLGQSRSKVRAAFLRSGSIKWIFGAAWRRSAATAAGAKEQHPGRRRLPITFIVDWKSGDALSLFLLGSLALKSRKRKPQFCFFFFAMSASVAAVLLDLAHACGCGCTERLLREEAAANARAPLFVLCAGAAPGGGGGGGGDVADAAVRAWGGRLARVLADWRATAACAYRLKRAADEAGALSLRVITSPRGRGRLLGYERALFTPLYTFTYRLGCGAEAPVREVDADVAAMLRALPPVGGALRLLTSPLLPDCFGHGFSTRGGGVSLVPALSSLNLFSSPRRRDSGALVQENRRRLALHAGFYPRPLQMLKVEHADRVRVLGKAEPERYDAAVTDRPGAVLAAPGADCVPVLFADPVAKAVGVAHAGWRGTLLGVAAATVSAMTTELGCAPADIRVVLGPSVGPCCFALEPEQAARFRPDCVGRAQGRRPNVDLRLANRRQLEEAGVLPQHIQDDSSVAPCTSCHPRDFFSHVRDGDEFGTQAGFVWIKDQAGPPSGSVREALERPTQKPSSARFSGLE